MHTITHTLCFCFHEHLILFFYGPIYYSSPLEEFKQCNAFDLNKNSSPSEESTDVEVHAYIFDVDCLRTDTSIFV